MLNDILTLVKMTITTDALLIQRETPVRRAVFCDASSISQAEYFEAAQTGLKPEYRFIILAAEYEDETLVEFHGIPLTVYRTYRRSKDYIELYTERRQGNGA